MHHHVIFRRLKRSYQGHTFNSIQISRLEKLFQPNYNSICNTPLTNKQFTNNVSSVYLWWWLLTKSKPYIGLFSSRPSLQNLLQILLKSLPLPSQPLETTSCSRQKRLCGQLVQFSSMSAIQDKQKTKAFLFLSFLSLS